jgi:hypothetical protein
MKATERYGLPFPEPEDFGDGAAQIAALADAINTELQERIDDYNTLLAPETYIRSRVTNLPFSSSTQYTTIFWDNEVYSSNLLLNGPSTEILKISTPGIYHAGMFVWAAVIGGITANSSRDFMLEFTDRRGPSLADQVELQWEQTTLEGANGVAVTQYAIFPVYTPEYAASGLRGYFRHQNAASQMQIQPPSCMWISRLGDLAV